MVWCSIFHIHVSGTPKGHIRQFIHPVGWADKPLVAIWNSSTLWSKVTTDRPALVVEHRVITLRFSAHNDSLLHTISRVVNEHRKKNHIGKKNELSLPRDFHNSEQNNFHFRKNKPKPFSLLYGLGFPSPALAGSQVRFPCSDSDLITINTLCESAGKLYSPQFVFKTACSVCLFVLKSQFCPSPTDFG